MMQKVDEENRGLMRRPGKRGLYDWLGSRDSNPDSMIRRKYMDLSFDSFSY